jgi:hypothetical protein
VDRDEGRSGDIAVAELLEDDRGVQPAKRRAADVLLDVEAAEAELRALTHHVDREVALGVPAGRVRGELGGGEGARCVLDGALVFGEVEIHAGRSQRGGPALSIVTLGLAHRRAAGANARS